MGTLDPLNMEDLAIVMTIPDTFEPPVAKAGHAGPTEIGGGPEGSADEVLAKIFDILKCYFEGDPDACMEPKDMKARVGKHGKHAKQEDDGGQEESDELQGRA